MERIKFNEFPAGLVDGLFKTEGLIKKSGLDEKMMELIKLRASQINKCAYCIDMHYKDAIHKGETELRLYSLPAWRECPFYSDKEKAVLNFTEVLTNTNLEDVSDEVYMDLEIHFSKAEILTITMAICQINSWNRINKTIRAIPGNYKVGMHG